MTPWVQTSLSFQYLANNNDLQATRWDNYLHIFDPKIHWFSLINSLIIVVFLCIMVSMILLRSVNKDVRDMIVFLCKRYLLSPLQISRYNSIDLSVRFM